MIDPRHEQALTELLDDLARADTRLALPPQIDRQIEQCVMERWDRAVETPASSRAIPAGIGASWRARMQRQVQRRVQGSGTYLKIGVAMGGLAAAVILAIALNRSPSVALVLPAARPAAVPAAAVTVAAGQQAGGDDAPAAPAAVAAVTSPAAAGRTARPARVRPDEVPRENVSFVPLSSTAQDLSGAFQVARVRLPREVLADLGVMLDANRVGEPIEADVVFGEDGLARAIRLAPASWRSQ